MRETVTWVREHPLLTAKYWKERHRLGNEAQPYCWPDLVCGARRVCTRELWRPENRNEVEVLRFLDNTYRYHPLPPVKDT